MRFYKSPIPIICSIEEKRFFDKLIQNAQGVNIINNTKEEKLDLLFWAMEFGLEKIYSILALSSEETLQHSLIQKLIRAMKSRYKGKYLKSTSIMPF